MREGEEEGVCEERRILDGKEWEKRSGSSLEFFLGFVALAVMKVHGHDFGGGGQVVTDVIGDLSYPVEQPSIGTLPARKVAGDSGFRTRVDARHEQHGRQLGLVHSFFVTLRRK